MLNVFVYTDCYASIYNERILFSQTASGCFTEIWALKTRNRALNLINVQGIKALTWANIKLEEIIIPCCHLSPYFTWEEFEKRLTYLFSTEIIQITRD